MKFNGTFFFALSATLSASIGTTAWAQKPPELLNEYCVKCHNFEDWAGGFDMEGLDFDHVEKQPNVWEGILKKVSTGMMPPTSQEKPTPEVMEAFITMVENQLDQSIATLPASPALHRLNRNEYKNAIRDIFDLEIDVTTLLPTDDANEGFDNVASSLGFSPALIQAYTSTAMKVSRWSVGDMSTTESSSIYNAPPGLAQDQHLEGMPLGTRGGLKVTHNFPLDANYNFSVRGGGGFGFGRFVNLKIDITLDGEVISVDNPRDFRLPLSAGMHTLTASLVDITRPSGVNNVYSTYSLVGSINTIEIIGPFDATGPGETTSRQRIFSCYPLSTDEETSCAEEIVTNIASRAFREPVTLDTLQSMMNFYQQGYREGNFDTGIQQALSRILIDPRFLFRFEEEPENLSPGEIYAISDLELASRLSFFLWSSIPDNELIELANNHRLSQPEVLRQQVQRMLSDPKALALVQNFSGQWLFLRDLASLTPEATDFDENLRQSFVEETQLLLGNIIVEDSPVTDLLNADYTFLNERLARHYGIDNVRGSYFRKVQLPQDSVRRGILGHGSILTVTSTASRTSPVIRGSWILENLLSAPVPDPPPGVETNLEGDGSVVLTSSIRSRLEAHRADPACSSCHSIIDPIGFSLENFDSIGAWREFDGDSPVDASGILVDGTPVNGPVDLREALMKRPKLFVSTLTEKLLIYALGRGLEYYDMPTVRSIIKQSEPNNYRFSDLVLGIVNSEQFLKRVKNPGSTTASL